MISDYKLYWKMDEQSGNLIDASGNGWTGTKVGTGLDSVSGKVRLGRKFNGVDDYVTSTYTSTALMTVSFWLNMTAPGATNNTGILFWNGTTVDGYITLEIAGTNPGIGIFKANQAFFKDVASVPILKDGFWHHIVFVINKSSAAASDIYIDAVIAGTYAHSSNQTFNTDTGFNVNHWVIDGTSRFAIGTFDEIRIYDRLLSSTEVKELYQFVNPYKLNNSGIRPRPFVPGHAR